MNDKFCINCTHCILEKVGECKVYYCDRVYYYKDKVTGEFRSDNSFYSLCSTQRTLCGSCGDDGKYYKCKN